VPTRKPPRDDADQSAKFLATAKEVEADNDGRAFMRALGVVVAPTNEPKREAAKLPHTPKSPRITRPKAAKKKAAGAISKG
jgi:hypothetical protein